MYSSPATLSSIRRDPKTFPGQWVLDLPRGLLPVRRSLNTSMGKNPRGILIRGSYHLNFWCKVAMEQLWAVIQHAILSFLSLPRVTQSFEWYLLVNQEPFFKAQLPLHHDSKMPTIYLLPYLAMILFSILLLQIVVVFSQFFNSRYIKRPEMTVQLKSYTNISVYIFTAGIIVHFGLRLFFLAPQLSFFSFIVARRVYPSNSYIHFLTLLNPYGNISCPVRLLAIQGGGLQCCEFRCFQVFFVSSLTFTLWIRSRSNFFVL